MTPEYRCRVRHTIVSLTVCSHYHHGCRPSLLTTSRVRHNFPCVDARALHGTPRLGGGRRRQRPSRQIFPWPSRCGGEEIRLIVRDKELFVNREQVRASFCKNGERWEEQHHHQLRTCLIHRILKLRNRRRQYYKFQTDITNVRSNAAPRKRELLGSLRKNFRYFRWMQHYRTN